MKIRIASVVFLLFFLFSFGINALAQEKYDVEETVNEIINAESYGELKNSSAGNDWVVFGLARNGCALKDFLQYVCTDDSSNATDTHRGALVTSALGENADELVKNGVFNQLDLGKQGLNGYIWALIVLDSKDYAVPEDSQIGREEIIEHILDSQNEDGGFSFNGKQSDADITAMALIALANYKSQKEVSAAIENGITWLSENQHPDGDFSSWGTENAESTAQVIIALCTLDMDITADERFIKNGNSLFDGMMKYYTGDGFAHYIDASGEKRYNQIATGQGLCALSAIIRFKNGENHLFDLTDVEESEISVVATADEKESIINGKALALIIVAVAAVFAIIISKKKKDIILIVVLAVLVIGFIILSDFQTVEEYYQENLEQITEDSQTVTLTIDCSDAIQSEKFKSSLTENGYIPENGIILKPTKYVLRSGDSVFDILERAIKHNKIQMEYQGTRDSAYIQGISWLYEFDCGDSSGWVYTVNGERTNYGVSQYYPKDGDVIRIYYTVEYDF